MSSLTAYKGLQVVTPDPSGSGGLAINNNFKKLSTNISTSNPSASNDGTQGYGIGSRWFNSANSSEWICTSSAVGAAVWQELASGGNPFNQSLNTTDSPTFQRITAAKQFVTTSQTLTDGATINWSMDAGPFAVVTLGGNRTLANPTNLLAGGTYQLIVKQDSTGSRTLSYGSAFKWPSGTAPVLTTAANAVDIITFVSDGTSLYGVCQKNFSAPTASYAATILATTGLQAYYQMDTTSGLTVVDSKNAYNGTLQPSSGGVWTGGTLAQSPLITGGTYSIQFNASSSGLLAAGGSSTILASAAAASLEAWVYPQVSNADQRIICFLSGLNSQYALIFGRTTNKFSAFFRDSSNNLVELVSPSTYSTNAIYHIVATVSGTTGTLYVNGSAVTTTTVSSTNTLTLTSAPATIGGFQNTSGAADYFTGRIDEVAIYSVALTAAQVSAHYALGS